MGLEKGLVQIYTGNSKGKTTCALGLSLRAVGHGLKVCILQFMKGGAYTGELYAAERLFPNLKMIQFGRGCPWAGLIKAGYRKCTGCGQCFAIGKGKEEDKELAQLAYSEAKSILLSEEYDLLVLDEITNALGRNLVSKEQILELIELKPEKIELVLTGRYFPDQEIIDAADLVTEMKQIKHPFEKGIASRRGIEY